MKHAMKNTLKPGSIALGLALMLTTLCYGQAFQASPPHNVIYWNGDTSNNQLQTLESSDYTDVIVNFVTPDGNCNLSGSPTDIGTIQALHSYGKTVLVSFGGQGIQYAACANIVPQLATNLATSVMTYGFDGVDIDFEDSNAFLGQPGYYDGVMFLTNLTNDLYNDLPQYQNIITHAPQTPYWTSDYNYAYSNIFFDTGDNIAWFNNQTYNNCPPTDCTAQEKIADYQNIASIVSPLKVLVGVPVSPGAAGNGYLPISDPSGNGNDMTSVILQLQNDFLGQFGGVMGWNYLHDISDDGGNWSSDLLLPLAARPVWVGYDTQTGRCLDSSINGNNGTVYTDTCNGYKSLSQEWYFDVNTIRNIATNQCLDSNSSGNLYTMPCNGGNYQNWWDGLNVSSTAMTMVSSTRTPATQAITRTDALNRSPRLSISSPK
ncbi:MAG: glycosyl hydrolase family 18 protein [Bryobacteraceae bacterium]